MEHAHQRHLFTDYFIEHIQDDGSLSADCIRSFLIQTETSPIKLQEVTADDFMTWIFIRGMGQDQVLQHTVATDLHFIIFIDIMDKKDFNSRIGIGQPFRGPQTDCCSGNHQRTRSHKSWQGSSLF